MEEYEITIRGLNVHYKHTGSGQPLVFFHGIPTNSSLWDGVIYSLSREYSIYAFDLLGFGKSSRAGSNLLDIKSQADFFREVLSSLKIQNPIICGHDYGGGIAQYFAVYERSSVRAVILIDSVCYDLWPIELLSAENTVRTLFEHLPVDIVHELFEKYISGGLYNKDKAPDVVKKYSGFIENEKAINNFLEIIKSFDYKYTQEIVPLLHKIRIPVLILWGRHDTYLKPSCAYRLNEDIRRSTIKIIDDGGHFLPEDQPKEVAQSIDSFAEHIDSGAEV